MRRVNGLHHITAIAGPAQENLDFYAGVLGMRLVKKSVNQDDPGTYHLFYADAEGRPGTDLTFFPWAQMAPPRPGHGLAVEVGLEVPPDSLSYWGSRLEQYGARIEAVESRFGTRVLPLVDPHGLRAGARRAGARPGASLHAVGAEHRPRRASGSRSPHRTALGAGREPDGEVSDGRSRLHAHRQRERLDALRLRRRGRGRRHPRSPRRPARRVGHRQRAPPGLAG